MDQRIISYTFSGSQIVDYYSNDIYVFKYATTNEMELFTKTLIEDYSRKTVMKLCSISLLVCFKVSNRLKAQFFILHLLLR